MTDAEFREGLENRQARVIVAASGCVRYHRRQMAGTMGRVGHDELVTAMSQARFNPVYQRELVEAILDLHDFETGSGKYRLTDAERLVKLEELAKQKNSAPWIKEELNRLRQQR